MLMFRFLFMYIIKKNAFYSEHSRQQAKHVTRHSRIRARDRSHLMFAADCKLS